MAYEVFYRQLNELVSRLQKYRIPEAWAWWDKKDEALKDIGSINNSVQAMDQKFYEEIKDLPELEVLARLAEEISGHCGKLAKELNEMEGFLGSNRKPDTGVQLEESRLANKEIILIAESAEKLLDNIKKSMNYTKKDFFRADLLYDMYPYFSRSGFDLDELERRIAEKSRQFDSELEKGMQAAEFMDKLITDVKNRLDELINRVPLGKMDSSTFSDSDFTHLTEGIRGIFRAAAEKMEKSREGILVFAEVRSYLNGAFANAGESYASGINSPYYSCRNSHCMLSDFKARLRELLEKETGQLARKARIDGHDKVLVASFKDRIIDTEVLEFIRPVRSIMMHVDVDIRPYRLNEAVVAKRDRIYFAERRLAGYCFNDFAPRQEREFIEKHRDDLLNIQNPFGMIRMEFIPQKEEEDIDFYEDTNKVVQQSARELLQIMNLSFDDQAKADEYRRKVYGRLVIPCLVLQYSFIENKDLFIEGASFYHISRKDINLREHMVMRDQLRLVRYLLSYLPLLRELHGERAAEEKKPGVFSRFLRRIAGTG